MNDFKSEQSHQELLDRLVDGELSAPVRRELLQQLDHQPDGWRRCALAFLEAQSWRGGLRSSATLCAPPALFQSTVYQSTAKTAAEPAPPAPLSAAEVTVAATPPRAAPRRGSWTSWSSPWSLAASVLAAFGLGIAVQESIWPSVPRADVAELSSPSGNLAVSTASQSQRSSPLVPANPMRNVTLVVGGDGDQRQMVNVPVSEAANSDPDWWQKYPAPVTQAERDHLLRAGHRVEQRRQLYPFKLQDGRSVVVPVDEVEVHPVSFH